MSETHDCCVCHLRVAPAAPHRHFNGSVVHEKEKPCLDKKVPGFVNDVGRLVSELAEYGTSFEAFASRIKEVRRVKEAERLATDLAKQLSFESSKPKVQGSLRAALEELKNLTQTHLFWELPAWSFTRPQNSDSTRRL